MEGKILLVHDVLFSYQQEKHPITSFDENCIKIEFRLPKKKKRGTKKKQKWKRIRRRSMRFSFSRYSFKRYIVLIFIQYWGVQQQSTISHLNWTLCAHFYGLYLNKSKCWVVRGTTLINRLWNYESPFLWTFFDREFEISLLTGYALVW